MFDIFEKKLDVWGSSEFSDDFQTDQIFDFEIVKNLDLALFDEGTRQACLLANRL
jgi:hypothetical protein